MDTHLDCTSHMSCVSVGALGRCLRVPCLITHPCVAAPSEAVLTSAEPRSTAAVKSACLCLFHPLPPPLTFSLPPPPPPCTQTHKQDAVIRGWFRTRANPLTGAPHLRVIGLTALEVAAAMAHLHANNALHGVSGLLG